MRPVPRPAACPADTRPAAGRAAAAGHLDSDHHHGSPGAGLLLSRGRTSRSARRAARRGLAGRRRGPAAGKYPHQAAGRRDQAGRPPVLPPQPSLESLLAERSLAIPFPPVSLPIRGRGVPLSPPRRGAGRRDGPGQNHAGHHRHPPACSRRGEVAKRAAGLPQAAGDQLAAGVAPLGPGDPRAGGRRRPGAAAVAVAVAGRAGADRQLRAVCRDRDAVRSRRRPRSLRFDLVVLDEVAADQEPRRQHQRGGPLDRPRPQLGPDRHARSKTAPTTWWASSSSWPRASFRRDEAAADGPDGQRLRAAADQGPGAHGPAAQAVPRRRAGTDAAAAGEAYELAEEEGSAAADASWASGSRSSTSSSWCCG